MSKLFTILFTVIIFWGCSKHHNKNTNLVTPAVRGWNILSNDTSKANIAINKADQYGINHLQLSHQLIMDLKDVRSAQRLRETRQIIDKAHKAGIAKVFVWDHSLYDLDYYPEEFKTKKCDWLCCQN